MSRAYESYYEIERRRREEIFNNRVCAKTEEFYQRYLEQYNQMIQNNFNIYIPEEMNRLKEDLAEIKRLIIANDGAEARSESMTVGSYIYSLSSLASSAKESFERGQKLRKAELTEKIEKNKEKIINYYYKILGSIKDPVIKDFAQDELTMLKKEFMDNGALASKSSKEVKNQINSKVLAILDRAKKKKEEWSKNVIESNKTEIKERMISDTIKVYSKEIDGAKNDISDKIKNFSGDVEQINEEIQNVRTELDNEMITEEVRREAAKSIIKTLKTQGFSVNQPTLKNGKVKISGKKPSGKRANCELGLDGNLVYSFDTYEGMSCLKDIEKFNVELEEIYSVKLSNEKIVWENPNKISKDGIKAANDRIRSK